MQISRELVGQQLTSEMGLCTLHNCCFSCLLDYLKSILKSNSHRPLTVLGFRVKKTRTCNSSVLRFNKIDIFIIFVKTMFNV